MGKLDVKKQLKLNSLLDAAFELFTQKGIVDTSISDISAQAGVAKGTFYLYFKDKLDIRDRLIVAKSHKLFVNAINSIEGSNENLSKEDTIIQIIEYIISEFEKNHQLLNFISKNLSWCTFERAVEYDENDNTYDLRSYFSKLCGENSNIMFFMIIELVSGVCHSSILMEEPVTMDEMRPHLYTTIRNIINQFS